MTENVNLLLGVINLYRQVGGAEPLSPSAQLTNLAAQRLDLVLSGHSLSATPIQPQEAIKLKDFEHILEVTVTANKPMAHQAMALELFRDPLVSAIVAGKPLRVDLNPANVAGIG